MHCTGFITCPTTSPCEPAVTTTTLDIKKTTGRGNRSTATREPNCCLVRAHCHRQPQLPRETRASANTRRGGVTTLANAVCVRSAAQGTTTQGPPRPRRAMQPPSCVRTPGIVRFSCSVWMAASADAGSLYTMKPQPVPRTPRHVCPHSLATRDTKHLKWAHTHAHNRCPQFRCTPTSLARTPPPPDTLTL